MNSRTKGVGLVAAVSIGVGGMIGAGIFSILGVVAQVSGPALPLSFAIGGVVALLAAYSYAKLGVRYPSVGGSVQFLVESLGDGVLTGGLNVFQYLAYVISMALYAAGFAGYAMTFLPDDTPSWVQRLLGAGIIVVFALVNLLGSKAMGRAESVIVIIKVTILVVFIVGAFISIDPDRLSPSGWPSGVDIMFGAGILFVGYEGFGLITNAAGDMEHPKRELPKAIYLAVGIVITIYVLVAIGVIGNLPIPILVHAQDYALAEAAKPFLGEAGFKLIAIAALLSTSSAVNATLFGASNVSYQIARDGQLPVDLHEGEVEPAHRRAVHHRRPLDRVRAHVRSGPDRHDGQRRLPDRLRGGERRAPQGALRDRGPHVAGRRFPRGLRGHVRPAHGVHRPRGADRGLDHAVGHPRRRVRHRGRLPGRDRAAVPLAGRGRRRVAAAAGAERGRGSFIPGLGSVHHPFQRMGHTDEGEQRLMHRRTRTGALAAVVLLGLVVAACGSDKKESGATTTAAGGATTTAGSGGATTTAAAGSTTTAASPAALEVRRERQVRHAAYKGNLAKLEAVDATTVKFTLCNPDVAMPGQGGVLGAADHAVGVPREGGRHQGGDFVNKPIGTGPYKLKQWDKRQPDHARGQPQLLG